MTSAFSMTSRRSWPMSIWPTTSMVGICSAQRKRVMPMRPYAPVITTFVISQLVFLCAFLLNYAAAFQSRAQNLAIFRAHADERQAAFVAAEVHHGQRGFDRDW